MNIIHKNEGPKVNYLVEGNNLISFRDELFINLAKCERDYPVHIDICEDTNGMLTNTISNKYIAQIDMPERVYTEAQDGTDEEGNTKTLLVPEPFDIERITLTLWSIA